MSALFEYPPAKISSDKNIIQCCETAEFNIRNVGCGTLEGSICADTDKIKIEPNHFKGNTKIKIFAENTKGFMSNIIISSNGGQLSIPVKVNPKSGSITAPNGTVMENIDDFERFSCEFPLDARRLIGTDDFYMWIKRLGFEDTDIFEHIITDSNKERAVDNLLILMGARQKTYILPEKDIAEYKTGRDDIIDGHIIMIKHGNGFVNQSITGDGKKWLRLKTDILNGQCFGKTGEALLCFEINPKMLESSYDESIIRVGDKEIKIKLTKIAQIRIRLDKSYYKFNDRGFLEIINDRAENAEFLIQSDNFIKIQSNVRVQKHSRQVIAFDIKISPIMKAQIDITKKPSITGNIRVYNDYFEESRTITAGY